MFGRFVSGIKYAVDVQNEIEKALDKAEAARLFDTDAIVRAVDAFHKDKVSVEDAAAYIVFKVNYEPKTRWEADIRDRLVQHFREQGLDIVHLNPEVFYKLVAVAIVRDNVEATAEWFSDILERDLDDGAFLHQFRAEARLWIS